VTALTALADVARLRAMRAFAVRSFGEAPAIYDLPNPVADGAYLVRVTYAGVNPIDYKLIDYLTAKSTYPVIIGTDFAGVVEAVPAGARDFRVGDRIFGMARQHGAYAERTAVAPGAKNAPIARIPDGVTDEQAAALPIPAVTALGSLDLLNLTSDQRIVIMGATGGVGGYATQMARSRGAHVIATVRGDTEEARRLGAVQVYDTQTPPGPDGITLPCKPDVITAIRNAHPDGVDAVLDLVSDANAIRRDAEILRPGGSVLSTIHVADEAWFATRQIKAYNIGPDNNPASSDKALGDIARMLVDGVITARVRSAVELAQAGQILDQLRHGGISGKAVIHI